MNAAHDPVELLEPTPGRPSVLVRGGHGEGGRRLLLCGHLDTEGHAGLPEPLVPRIGGDRLYARGATSMSASALAFRPVVKAESREDAWPMSAGSFARR